MGLIFDQNYRDLEQFYDFVLNDVGADKLKLNFIQPSFGDNETDRFLADHHNIDPDELGAVLEKCDARFDVGINPALDGQCEDVSDLAARRGGPGSRLGLRGPNPRSHLQHL